ncbi:unnamed protein product [Ambrosiozyma monospora]|uniref:Unnamed protein product n=1 Tax=Ambrosiozyma monospora TaxID=43982 RepID=A0A9W6Z1T2_AMBMO|nr:unnamed protein product [Ambrosiozyma monospora]
MWVTDDSWDSDNDGDGQGGNNKSSETDKEDNNDGDSHNNRAGTTDDYCEVTSHSPVASVMSSPRLFDPSSIPGRTASTAAIEPLSGGVSKKNLFCCHLMQDSSGYHLNQLVSMSLQGCLYHFGVEHSSEFNLHLQDSVVVKCLDLVISFPNWKKCRMR